MHDTCPNCKAITPPDWQRCLICGADLTPEGRRATQAALPSGSEQPTGRKGPDEQKVIIATVVGMAVLACVIVGAIFVFGSSAEDKKAKTAATLPTDETTTTTARTTTTWPARAPRVPAEVLGVTLPADDLVYWEYYPEAVLGSLLERELEGATIVLEADALKGTTDDHKSGVTVIAFKIDASLDVRSQEYADAVGLGITGSGGTVTKFKIGERPALTKTSSNGRSYYLFGINADTLLQVSIDGDMLTGDAVRLCEAIINANP